MTGQPPQDKLLFSDLLRTASSQLAGANAVSLHASVPERGADKRAAGVVPLTVIAGVPDAAVPFEDLTRLDDALLSLRQVDDRCFQVAETRYFAGVTEQGMGPELPVSAPTIKRDGCEARAFLFEQMR